MFTIILMLVCFVIGVYIGVSRKNSFFVKYIVGGIVKLKEGFKDDNP